MRDERMAGRGPARRFASIDRWRRLSQDSARYNIGTIIRTLNVPTFALIVLHASNPSRFGANLSFTTRPDP